MNVKQKQIIVKSICFSIMKTSFSYLNTVFLDCHVLLCDFHREEAWDHWLSAHANGVRQFKEVILAHLM